MRVGIHERLDPSTGLLTYVFSIRAFGDFSAATDPTMTSHAYLGKGVGVLTATWAGKPGRWYLTQDMADAAAAVLFD
jgi:hypothetical protein